MNDETKPNEIPESGDTTAQTDLFLWANQTDGKKEQLDIELFLFNKNYTVYSMKFAKELETQIRALCLYDMVNQVNMGAGTGMGIREFEKSEMEENTVLVTDTERVENARKVLVTIEKNPQDIEAFSEEEHDFKRMKGLIVRFSTKGENKASFYAAKLLQQSNAIKGSVSWEINGDSFELFKADVGLKIPSDNQVLIVDKDIFVFSSGKFEKLFGYDYKKQLLADQKVAEIEKSYKLSFPEGADLQSLVKEKPAVVRKLQTLEVGGISQEQALEYADDMQLDLMTDDAGAIIIMDTRDLDTFVNLINEDYITSEITGRRYVIKSKKLLDAPDGEPPRG